MKKIFVVAIGLMVILLACRSTKQLVSDKMDINQLSGSWELDSIAGPTTGFRQLYPGKTPAISFLVKEKQVSGNSGCNSFGGPITIEGFNIDFNGPLATTKMACPGEGEAVFFDALKKVTRFAVTDSVTLNLIQGDVPVMRFHKTGN